MKRGQPEKKISSQNSLKIVFEDLSDFNDEVVVSEIFNWQPLYNLYTTSTDLIITIEIAGVDEKDISLYVGPQYMVINGIRSLPEPPTNQLDTELPVFHNLEIAYGRFSRKIDFPVMVKHKDCQYKIAKGVLSLRFPVIEERIIPIE